MHILRRYNLMSWGPYALAVTLVIVSILPAQAATININNTDIAGFGLRDPEQRAPIGGNDGATLGQQRLNVFHFAAKLWGKLLQSNVPIIIDASFATLTCDANSAILGGASTLEIFTELPGLPHPNMWYPAALTNALLGEDKNPAFSDIITRFNAQIEGNPGCLGGRRWYYGLDHNSGNDIDFLNVVMHELAHGLGFASQTNETTGTFYFGRPSIYDMFVRDLSQNLTWTEMADDAQRRSSAINTGNLVWDGPSVNEAAASLIGGTGPNGMVLLYAPNPVEFGSSIYHWDTSVTPNALMESFISKDLKAADGVDLTTCLLADIGWKLNLPGGCLHLPHIMLAPKSLDFGNQPVGARVTKEVIATNTGSADLKIGTAAKDSLAIPFSIAADTCSKTILTSGNTCKIEVQFEPNSTGTFSDSFDIPSNDPDATSIVKVIGKAQLPLPVSQTPP